MLAQTTTFSRERVRQIQAEALSQLRHPTRKPILMELLRW